MNRTRKNVESPVESQTVRENKFEVGEVSRQEKVPIGKVGLRACVANQNELLRRVIVVPQDCPARPLGLLPFLFLLYAPHLVSLFSLFFSTAVCF